MWLLTALSGSKWSVVLSVMAVVTPLISVVTMLIGYSVKSRSAPVREVVFRTGLCLIAMWPILAILIGLVTPGGAAATTAASVNQEVVVTQPPRQPEPAAPLRPAPEPAQERVAIPAPASVAATPSTTVPSVSIGPPLPSRPPAPPAAQPTIALSPSRSIESQPAPSNVLSERRTPRPSVAASPAPAVAIEASSGWPLEFPVLLVVALRWLAGFWTLGGLVAGFFVARDLFRVRQLRHQLKPCHDASIAVTLVEAMRVTGLRHSPEVFVSDCVGSPCTSGVWKPILILPQTMLDQPQADPAMQLGVLTHECAHIARRDVAWALSARLVQSVYWWEPGLRRIVRELSHLREEICDNHVLSSSIDVRQYAKALVDFAAAPLARPLIGVIGMVANDNPLSGRVERLLEESPDQTTRVEWRSRRGVAYIVLVAFGVIGVIGASSKVAGALAQVLLPAFEEPESSRATPVASGAVPRTPVWSGESRVSRGTLTTAASLAAAAEKDTKRNTLIAPSFSTVDTEPFGTPQEAGSGTFNPPPPTDFSEQFEAGSGIVEDSEMESPFPPGTIFEPTGDDAPVTILPRTQAAPNGTAQPASPSTPHAKQPTRMKAVTSTEIVNGKPVVITRVVPIVPDEDSSPTFAPDKPIPGNLPTPSPAVPMYQSGAPNTHGNQNEPTVQKHQIRNVNLHLAEDPKLQHGDQVVVAVTHSGSEGSLPNRIYFEGLTYNSPKDKPTSDSNEKSPEVDPFSDFKPTDVPPAPPAVTPAEATNKPDPAAPPATDTGTPDTSGWFLFSGRESTANALAYLQSQGAVTSVTKAEPSATANNHSKNGLDPIPDEPGTVFRMSLEAVTNNPGQWIGLRCWGRDLPGETPELRLTELTRVLTRWKEECKKEPHPYRTRQLIHPETGQIIQQQYAVSDRNPSKLVATLRIIDNMRYSDVQLIVAACEALQIQTQVITNAQPAADVIAPMAYTSAELTLVYDKKGQKVGNRAVLLAGHDMMIGAQVIADPQFNSVLNSFALSHPQCYSTLLLKVDPDLPLEPLLSFIARANRAGFKNVELLPREELHIRPSDQFGPLLRNTQLESQPVPVGSSAPLYAPQPVPTYDSRSVPAESDDDNQPQLNFSPTTEDSEPLSALPVPTLISRSGRIRHDPLPIPAMTGVNEH